MPFTLTRRTLIGSGVALALPSVARANAPDLKADVARLVAEIF